MKGWQGDFKVWCNHYLLDDNLKVSIRDSEEAVDALYWTGSVLYELDLLWNKQARFSLSEKTIMYYRKKWTADMFDSHTKFCNI
jgi:hypothetical protein